MELKNITINYFCLIIAEVRMSNPAPWMLRLQSYIMFRVVQSRSQSPRTHGSPIPFRHSSTEPFNDYCSSVGASNVVCWNNERREQIGTAAWTLDEETGHWTLNGWRTSVVFQTRRSSLNDERRLWTMNVDFEIRMLSHWITNIDFEQRMLNLNLECALIE